MATKTHSDNGRRDFIKKISTGAVCAGLGIITLSVKISKKSGHVWQIDPMKCIQCGRCATECVLEQSAVKCVHQFSMCGYCNLCFGFFQPGARVLSSDAENQLCPTGAIKRKYIEDPYFEYTVDELLCIGCGKCVTGCNSFGNGSLYLQVKHDICINCNECSISGVCPSDAFIRVPEKSPYIKKGIKEV